MTDDAAKEARALFLALVESEQAFYRARMAFMRCGPERVAVLREALDAPAERGTALRLLAILDAGERAALLDDLVAQASVSHADIQLCRDAILSLPREGLMARIERAAEPLLRDGTYEEYRRLLELYIQIDRDATRRLAERARESDDEDIREAGEDFVRRLDKTSSG